MYGLRKVLLIGSVLLFCACTPVFLRMESFGENGEKEAVSEEDASESASSGKGSSIPVRDRISDSIPSVFITTKSGSLAYVEADKENAESGYMTILSEAGDPVYSGQLERLKGRGNTSWDAPKKSYSLKLSSRASLLGMEAAENWILTANYYDGAYIRNAMGAWLSERAGLPGTVQGRFVDLYGNGEYRGLYQLMERVELQEGRIDAVGGWLLEMDYPERAACEDNVLYLENGQPVVIHDPAKVSDGQMEALESWFTEMKKALYADDYINPDTGKGIFAYLDLDSFARKYLLEEVLLNMDMGVTSHYLYLDESGRLHEGPLWDLDNALGRGNYEEDQLLALQGDPARNQMLRWYIRLCANDVFYDRVLEIWEKQVFPALLEAEEAADQMLEPLRDSIRADRERWPGVHSTTMPETDPDKNLSYLKEYLRDRTEVLRLAFSENAQDTKAQLQERTAQLPEETVIGSAEGAETADRSGQEEEGPAGLREGLLASHGMICLILLLLVLGLLIAADRRRGGGK